MYTELLPRLMKVKEDYFVITRRIPLTASENRYRIPNRAAGQKLRDLFYIDSAGTRCRIPHISREHLDEYAVTPATEPEGYYLEGTHIVLVPELSGSSGSLEVSYFFRPGQLVRNLEVRQITSMTNLGAT